MLAEFGTVIPEEVEIHISDSTAMDRYLVLPKRPDGTDKYSEEQLAALVTRDTMIGMVPTSSDREGPDKERGPSISLSGCPTTLAGWAPSPSGASTTSSSRGRSAATPWRTCSIHKIVNTEEKRRRVEALGAEVVGARGSSACPGDPMPPYILRGNTIRGEVRAAKHFRRREEGRFLEVPKHSMEPGWLCLGKRPRGLGYMLLARAVIYLRPLAEPVASTWRPRCRRQRKLTWPIAARPRRRGDPDR